MLQYALEQIRADREAALMAVGMDGRFVDGEVLKYTSEELHVDLKVILAALRYKIWQVLHVASEDLLADDNVLLVGVR